MSVQVVDRFLHLGFMITSNVDSPSEIKRTLAIGRTAIPKWVSPLYFPLLYPQPKYRVLKVRSNHLKSGRAEPKLWPLSRRTGTMELLVVGRGPWRRSPIRWINLMNSLMAKSLREVVYGRDLFRVSLGSLRSVRWRITLWEFVDDFEKFFYVLYGVLSIYQYLLVTYAAWNFCNTFPKDSYSF